MIDLAVHADLETRFRVQVYGLQGLKFERSKGTLIEIMSLERLHRFVGVHFRYLPSFC